MKILVTGGAGFLGANMTRKLVELGAEVTVLVRSTSNLWRLNNIMSQINLFKGELADSNFLEHSLYKTNPEIVFNFAFPSGHPAQQYDRKKMLSIGLMGTYALLCASKQAGVARFIQIGSSMEYGPSQSPHKESDAIRPISIRGVGKGTSTLICTQFACEFNFPVNILRLYAVYGPMEQSNRLVPQACRAALTGNKLSLTPPGIMHDWIYVDDVSDACIKACDAQLDPGEIVNVGSGKQYANEEIVHFIETISDTKITTVPAAHPQRKFDTTYWRANVSKAKTLLGWSPQYPLQKGLKLSFKYWKDQFIKKGNPYQ